MSVETVLARLPEIRDDLGRVYCDLHAHPELSFAEFRTAALVAERLTGMGLDVTTGIGKTGVVGVLRNGDGPTVLLRADLDALPVAEGTGLPYASTAYGTDPRGDKVPVMHACGHDVHITCLLGALELLAGARQAWSGTVLAVFQPAEEVGGGARSMVDDGLFERFGRPTITLGQHVAPLPAGVVGVHPGPAFAAADAVRVRLFGRGGHGSRPETTIDPVVMAAAVVLRLQTVVSREIAGSETAVVTVGAIQAGSVDNIIPDEAELKISVRSFTEPVRAKLLAAIERIVRAEAAASGAEREPECTVLNGSFPVLYNDPDATGRTISALTGVFGAERVIDPGPVSGSEDFGIFGSAAGAPACYWLLGGIDPATLDAAMRAGTVDRDIPSNHSPRFAPLIEPTLSTGVTAMVTAALAWLTRV